MKLMRSLLLIVATVVCQNTTIQGMARTIDCSAVEYHYEEHALKRMHERNVTPAQVSHVIENGSYYPQITDNRYLFIDLELKLGVIIVPKDRVIVTVMPDADKDWLDDWFAKRDAAVWQAKLFAKIKAKREEGKTDGEIREENWDEEKTNIYIKNKKKKKQSLNVSYADAYDDYLDEDFGI